MLDNINPAKWGESYWKMSHYITFSYPINPSNDDKNNIKIYFDNLKNLLPCENCRFHYNQYITTNPLTNNILSSKQELINWLIYLHNDVNKRTGKKIYTYDEIYDEYMNNKNKQIVLNYTNEHVQIFGLILIIFLLILYMKKK
jgi:hypothetical protein